MQFTMKPQDGFIEEANELERKRLDAINDKLSDAEKEEIVLSGLYIYIVTVSVFINHKQFNSSQLRLV